MYKQIQSQFFLVAFLLCLHTGTANAKHYQINANFKQYPGSVSHIVLIDTYCMDSADSNVKLNGSYAAIYVDTSGGVFSKCGWTHSSATYHALNDKNEVKVEFEFYKPLSKDPYIDLKTPGVEPACSVSNPDPWDPSSLYIDCGVLP